MANQLNKRKQDSYVLLEHAFKKLHAPLYFHALKFVDSPEVAKDLVQDAFLSILNTKSSEGIENLKAYLFRAVRNNCFNYIKHTVVKSEFAQKEQERIQRELEFYDTHKTLVEKELQQKLSEAIEQLPEKYKIPFKLCRIEELKTIEVANQLNLPVRTVETQIYRALKILRKKFSNQKITLFALFVSKKS